MSFLGLSWAQDKEKAERETASAQRKADEARRERDQAERERQEAAREREDAFRSKEAAEKKAAREKTAAADAAHRQRDAEERAADAARRQRDAEERAAEAKRRTTTALEEAKKAQATAEDATLRQATAEKKTDEAMAAAADAKSKIDTYEQAKQDEMDRLQSETEVLKRVKKRRAQLTDRFEGQKILMIGKPGCGKSSVINSFNFVVNLCSVEDAVIAEYEEVCETSAATMSESKTSILKTFGPDYRNMYREVSVEQRSRCPSFFDVCGIPNRSDVKKFIRSLAEGKVDVGTKLHSLLETRSQELDLGDRRQEMASWIMIFVLSATEDFPTNLGKEVKVTLKELTEDRLDCRLFVLVTKVDKEADNQETIENLKADAIQVLGIEKSRIFEIVNFLPEDRDEDYEMKPVPAKQMKFINVFRQILAPAAKPDWVPN